MALAWFPREPSRALADPKLGQEEEREAGLGTWREMQKLKSSQKRKPRASSPEVPYTLVLKKQILECRRAGRAVRGAGPGSPGCLLWSPLCVSGQVM